MANNATTAILPQFDDSPQRLALKTAALLAASLGLFGKQHVTDTAAHPGNWWIFHALTDCVIADVAYADGTSAAAVSLKAGDRVYGRITSLSLTSGTGELYAASA